MKILKVFAMTMIALLLTGCYTQLQYSQTMRKITDEEKKEAKTYPQNDQVREEAQVTQQPDEYVENESEEYVPIYYKDYDYADGYDKCNCNPYYSYNFYGDSYFFPSYGSWYDYYRPRLGIGFSTGYFSPWHHRRYFGHSFAFTFSWGYPHSYYYYDSFHYPFYDYWYHRPIAYNYFYFYGNSRYGYGYYGEKYRKSDRNVRYGPRNTGSNRVVSDRNRSGETRVRSRSTVNSGSRQGVRSRSVGTSRTRATVKRNSNSSRVSRTRNSDANSSSARTRSRDDIQNNSSRERVYIDRTGQKSTPVVIDRDRYREIRSRTLRNNSARALDRSSDIRSNSLRKARINDLRNRVEQRRPTFFDRMKSFFENNSSRIINSRSTNRSTNRTIRARSSSNRSSISRSSSSSRSKVTRSRSSSGNSRSKGSSSRSRSGGGSSDSDRSRGN